MDPFCNIEFLSDSVVKKTSFLASNFGKGYGWITAKKGKVSENCGGEKGTTILSKVDN